MAFLAPVLPCLDARTFGCAFDRQVAALLVLSGGLGRGFREAVGDGARNLEVGFVLFLMPWTVLWDTNYFFSITPELNRVWLSTYLRGAVSGVGLVNLWIGLGEAWRLRRA